MTQENTPLSAEELDELRRLEQEATKGPWTAHRQEGGQIAGLPAVWVDFGRGGIEVGNGDRAYLDSEGYSKALGNARIIVAARNLLPRLLATVDGLSAQLAQAQAACAEYRAVLEGA